MLKMVKHASYSARTILFVLGVIFSFIKPETASQILIMYIALVAFDKDEI